MQECSCKKYNKIISHNNCNCKKYNKVIIKEEVIKEEVIKEDPVLSKNINDSNFNKLGSISYICPALYPNYTNNFSNFEMIGENYYENMKINNRYKVNFEIIITNYTDVTIKPYDLFSENFCKVNKSILDSILLIHSTIDRNSFSNNFITTFYNTLYVTFPGLNFHVDAKFKFDNKKYYEAGNYIDKF